MKRGPSKLVVPQPKEVDSGDPWYHKYKRLSSAEFTYGNSGNKENLPPPFSEVKSKDDDYQIVDIEGLYGMGRAYTIVGYTENPPFQPNEYHAVAIMFEHTGTFEKTWWHYRSGKDIDVRTLPDEYFGDVLKQEWDYNNSSQDDEEDVIESWEEFYSWLKEKGYHVHKDSNIFRGPKFITDFDPQEDPDSGEIEDTIETIKEKDQFNFSI